jgi:GNAT superfamily N-acetyltransferase
MEADKPNVLPRSNAVFVRPAETRDAKFLKEIAMAAYAKFLERMEYPPGPLSYDYAKIVAEGNTFIIDADERPVGMVTLQKDGEHLLLRNLAVLPDYQGRGFGGYLIDHAVRIAQMHNLVAIRLWTHEKMFENVPYYERNGFIVTHHALLNGRPNIFMTRTVI